MTVSRPHLSAAVASAALLLAACAGSNGDGARDAVARDDVTVPAAVDAAPSDTDTDPSGDLPPTLVVPSAPASEPLPASPAGGSPVLSIDDHDVAFRDVIRFLNEEPFTRLTELAPSVATYGVEWVSTADEVSRETVPPFRVPPLHDALDEAPFPGPIRRSDYRCTQSGALTIYRSAGDYGSVFVPSGCSARDIVYDGLVFERLAPGHPYHRTVSASGLSAVSLDGTGSGRLESGVFDVVLVSDEPVVSEGARSVARRVSGVVYEGLRGDEPIRVDNYALSIDYDAPGDPSVDERRTVGLLPGGGEIALRFRETALALESRFDISASWTGGQPVRVQVELGFSDGYWAHDGWYPGVTSEALGLADRNGAPLELDHARDPFFHWKRGEIRIEAADGSALSLVPRDATTFLIRADDGEIVRRQKAPGYEIHCTPYPERYLRVDCSFAGQLANPR